MSFKWNREQLNLLMRDEDDAEQANAPQASRRRILHVAGSMFISNGLTILLQLLMVPALIWAWGATVYGEWLILYTIPGYLSLMDFGIIATANNRIEALCARRRFFAANRTYLNSMIVLSSVIGVVLGVGVVFWVVAGTPFVQLFETLGRQQVALVAAILFIDAMVTLVHNHHSALYRTLGKFNWTVNWQAIGRVTPIVGLCVGALAGASLPAVAMIMLFLRLVLFGAMIFDLRRKITWLQRQWVRGNRRETVKLLGGAVGFMTLPLSNMIYLHGTTLIVAAVSSPVMVATFSTMRTFTRMIPQFVAIAGRSRWSEIAKSFARNEQDVINKMLKNVLVQTAGLSTVALVGYLILGKPFYLLWTGDALPFDRVLFLSLLANAIMIAGYYSLEVFLLATNRVKGYAQVFLAATLLQLGAGYLLIGTLGIAAFPITGIIASIIVFVYLYIRIKRTLPNEKNA